MHPSQVELLNESGVHNGPTGRERGASFVDRSVHSLDDELLDSANRQAAVDNEEALKRLREEFPMVNVCLLSSFVPVIPFKLINPLSFTCNCSSDFIIEFPTMILLILAPESVSSNRGLIH